jgi:hypothetical protein
VVNEMMGALLIDKYALARRRKRIAHGRTHVELHKPAFGPWSARPPFVA